MGNSSFSSVVLVSAPWPIFRYPSIQLGSLKAHLRQDFPDLKVDTHHFYLKAAEAIGYKLYQAVSERMWLAESVYAALLFPEQLRTLKKVFRREASHSPLTRNVDMCTLLDHVRKVSNDFTDAIDWGSFGLAGFSVCLCQLTSSLYFMRRIKQRFPNLPIVVGGSAFAGEAGSELFKQIPEIDFIVRGEGELPLSRLVRHLRNPEGKGDLPSGAGIVTRNAAQGDAPVPFEQMESLEHLPSPDYEDYFDLLQTFGPGKTFLPTITAEISRGCWWRRSQAAGRSEGCNFCNLNLQWEGYRTRNPSRVVSEIDQQTSRYRTLSVAFMDNALPARESADIFEKLGRLKKDFRFFAEVRASTSKHTLEAMRNAGLQEVQIGIEALSTRLLRKMNKGTSAMQNLEIMKCCEELGITNMSNLMIHFPGSDEQDVEETLRTLDFGLPFRPLKIVRFWLGFESPVWQEPREFGIKSVFNHPNYAAMLPPAIFKAMHLPIQGYRGDIGFQRNLWRPVEKKVKIWEKTYARLNGGPCREPILGFRDGREFLIIYQKQADDEPLTHRLAGTSREIYLFCGKHRSLENIAERFPKFSLDKLAAFLHTMVGKRLMFTESDRFLSLAVPLRGKDGRREGATRLTEPL